MAKKKLFLNREAYAMAVTGGKHAELTMYGDIVQARPVDPWTGTEVQGNFIIQSEFLEDLEMIRDCSDLTIHLNSCGGDAFVAIAIHNRLKELADAGMQISCVVDGAAMSGGSLIMCACDPVKVNPSSIILIHDCWAVAFDKFNSTKLRKLADDLDVINESQAEIYANKTGMDREKIREMMQKETMLTGRQAAEMGFADAVIADSEEPDIEVSADHRMLYVNGRAMRFAAMVDLPENIRTHEETVEPVSTDGDDINSAEPSVAATTGGVTSMTLEEFRAQYPEAAEELDNEARASFQETVASAREDAANIERERIAGIDEISCLYDAEIVRAAKYGENRCTAEQLAFRAAQEMAKQGRTFMEQLNADHEESGAGEISAAVRDEDSDAPMTKEQLMAAGREAAKTMKEGN